MPVRGTQIGNNRYVSSVAFLLLPVAYLIGTFPSAILVARASGVDITASGSGNPGASNVSRTLGWKRGLIVFALDATKGAIAAGIGWGFDSRITGYVCVGAAALGHMYPITRRFKGGKGVATVGGAMFVLQPIVAAILLATWFLISKVTRKASMASIAIAALLPVGAAIAGSPGTEVVAIVCLAVLVMVKHVENIKRLLRHEELSITSVDDKNH
jgi:acyl phosphate:glycerol-3-phosphate acyltransferase